VFHNLAVPVLHLFILIVTFLSLYVDELNDDDDDDDDDDIVGRINEINQHGARLVHRWVTVCRLANHLCMYPTHPGQLILTIPPWRGAMSTSESCNVNRHTE